MCGCIVKKVKNIDNNIEKYDEMLYILSYFFYKDMKKIAYFSYI